MFFTGIIQTTLILQHFVLSAAFKFPQQKTVIRGQYCFHMLFTNTCIVWKMLCIYYDKNKRKKGDSIAPWWPQQLDLTTHKACKQSFMGFLSTDAMHLWPIKLPDSLHNYQQTIPVDKIVKWVVTAVTGKPCCYRNVQIWTMNCRILTSFFKKVV